MIRLIVLDLDQTVMGSDLTISPRVKTAISRAQARGIMLTLATGREARLAARFAGELGITAPIICAQGGCIYDPQTDQVLHEVRLPRAVLPAVVASATRYGWNIHFETADRLYFPPASRHPEAIFELLRYSNWARVGDLLQDMPEEPHKFIVTLDRLEDRERVLREMRESLGGQVTAVPSHPHLIEGVPAGVNKAHGLAWLGRHLGFGREEAMAIGDSESDIPMLEWAEIGVAMGNSSPAVKAVAAWVAPTLAEDGAAVAIERFALLGE